MSDNNSGTGSTSNKANTIGGFNSVPESDKSRLRSARRHALVRQEKDREGVQRTRPEISGGPRLQMSVAGEIPGYHLYWENDEDGAIEQLLSEGFDFVTQEELQQREALVVPDMDISSAMTRYVKGQRNDGSPLRAFLMKCTDEVWADRERQRNVQADQWDADIRAQASAVAPGTGRYKPKGFEASIDTKYRKEY